MNLVLSVDHDGVVRVVNCGVDHFVVTPDEVAKLLTGLLAAFVSTQDDNEVINVSLN